MQSAVPYLMASSWFDSTYRRWVFLKRKTSVMSFILARAYALQISSLIAKERPGDPVILMKFVGIDAETANDQLNAASELIPDIVDRFHARARRMPLSPIDLIFNTTFGEDRIATMYEILKLDAFSLDDTLKIDKHQAHERIWYDSILGIAFGLVFPQLVNASLYLHDGDLLFESDDQTGIDADTTRAIAESETLWRVAGVLNPHSGVYKHLNLWEALELRQFANAPPRLMPMRQIDDSERVR